LTREFDRSVHGWWPYLLPYCSFLAVVQFATWLPESLAPLMLAVKPAVPLALMIYFWRRGEYPELRDQRYSLSGGLQDVAVGVLLALLWMAPYIFVGPLQPDSSFAWSAFRPESSSAFDPTLMGEALIPLALGLRLFGYALVTPLFEELFIRSFVMRVSEVYWERGDFRDVPLALYSRHSFITTIVVFTIGHAFWEWWVAVPWVVLTNLWFYHRRSLPALIVVHGVTNAALLIFAICGSDLFRDASGAPISLWFFV